MLSFVLPVVLALIGCGLAALALFAPRPSISPAVSFAPPLAFAAESFASSPLAFAPHDPEADLWANVGRPWAAAGATWTSALDARAEDCDAEARVALVEALGDLRTPWADALLRRACADEPDSAVRAAAHAALARLDATNAGSYFGRA